MSDWTRPVIGVLCGGPSTRMGTDKSSLVIGGESLLERVVRNAMETGCQVAVSGRERPDGWPYREVEFIRDEVPFLGPLHGIARLLERFQRSILAVGCDMPLLTPEAFEWLISQAADNMLADGLAAADSDERIHPLFSIYTPRVFELIERMCRIRYCSAKEIIAEGRFGRVTVTPEVEPLIFSVNTPREFELVKKALEDSVVRIVGPVVEERVIRTVCPRNCYCTCGMLVTVRESRFILLWGHNPAETNVHQMRLIFEAQERGALLAVIDPRSTDTTDSADMHLQPRPGTDAALALGIAYVLQEEGLLDWRFLERSAVGLEVYLERVRAYHTERVAEITGFSETEIRDLAVTYGSTRPALMIAGFGLQRHRHAGQAMRAAALLPALTGNVGVRGGGWQYANLASHRLRQPPLPAEPVDPGRSLPIPRLGSEILDSSNPDVRAVWLEKANPVSQHPRTALVRKALEKLDLIVVVDQFLTDTARMAHYVLPAKTLFEEEDLVTAYWHPYLQLRQRVLDPPDGVKTETEIWRILCERFGFETHWFGQDRRQLLRSMLPEGEGDLLERMMSEPVTI